MDVGHWALLVWLLVTATAVVTVAVVCRSSVSGSGNSPLPTSSPHPAQVTPVVRRKAAIIANPTKFGDPNAVRHSLTRACRSHGWDDPLWLQTTADSPGTLQAWQATSTESVSVVCALGGDGTVRAVAEALVGTTTPLGVLPAGTGNLLARNLGLPIDSREEALQIALHGHDRRIDVGTVDIANPEDGMFQDSWWATEPLGTAPSSEQLFLVVAGIGFDADVLADVPEELKAQVGWGAYVLTGLRNLSGKRFQVGLRVDDGLLEQLRVRTVMVGNCGRLQGGVELLPDAEIDDGLLDTVALAPRGVVDWARLSARIIGGIRRDHPMVEHRQGHTVDVLLHDAQELQLDGDPVGSATFLRFGVRPASLTVRVPRLL